jgi:Lar family restriction alleviation protein
MTRNLPCPFCGSLKIDFIKQEIDGHDYNWQILCDGCSITTGGYKTEEDAIAFWNKRCEPNSFDADLIAYNAIKNDPEFKTYTVALTCSHTVSVLAKSENEARENAESFDWVIGSDMSPEFEQIQWVELDE